MRRRSSRSSAARVTRARVARRLALPTHNDPRIKASLLYMEQNLDTKPRGRADRRCMSAYPAASWSACSMRRRGVLPASALDQPAHDYKAMFLVERTSRLPHRDRARCRLREAASHFSAGSSGRAFGRSPTRLREGRGGSA